MQEVFEILPYLNLRQARNLARALRRRYLPHMVVQSRLARDGVIRIVTHNKFNPAFYQGRTAKQMLRAARAASREEREFLHNALRRYMLRSGRIFDYELYKVELPVLTHVLYDKKWVSRPALTNNPASYERGLVKRQGPKWRGVAKAFIPITNAVAKGLAFPEVKEAIEESENLVLLRCLGWYHGDGECGFTVKLPWRIVFGEYGVIAGLQPAW